MALTKVETLYGTEHGGIVYQGVISEAEWDYGKKTGNGWAKFTLLSRSGRETRTGDLVSTRYVVWVPAAQFDEFRALFPDKQKSTFGNWEDKKIVPEDRRAATVHFGKTGYQRAEASGKVRMDPRTHQPTMWADIVVSPERVDFTPPKEQRRQPLPSSRTTSKK
ncbi:hypothetical protein [Streptomyces sp. NPDC048188]|uniref:hypothetical protein n=1 Tax=Streptomyces sp. NPDC048188 TaxID=3155749 RepID=UPI00343612F0